MSRPGLVVLLLLVACAPPTQLSRGGRQLDAVEEFIAAPFWDRERLTPVVRLIRQGALEEAADTVLTTWKPSPDPAHHRLARELLIGLGRWSELGAMVGTNNAAGDVIAALAAIPPEEYTFKSGRSIAKLSYSTANTPVVEVEIDGSKHRFWLDTGTGISIVGTDLAEKLGIEPVSKARASVRTVTGRLIDAAPAVIPLLRTGAMEARNHHVLIIETKELQVESLWGLLRIFKIEGILGWNFIQHADLEIDMRRKQLTIRKPGKPRRSGRNMLWLGWPFVVTTRGDGQTAILGLDTGSSISFVTPELIEDAGMPIIGYRETSLQGVGGVSTQIVGIAERLELAIGSERLAFDSMSVHAFTIETLLKPQGVLGADVMNWGTLRLDWASGRLTVRPYEKPHQILLRSELPAY
jgi:predicted aspartyl protease